ncbi:NRDE family protein [Psychrobacillus sp. FSL W7-1457]|uniref:NRDE family protein n=1 Tax=unclassified Psychrobacillus TaxID=2636677 RepID=UPI0030FBC304
MCLVNFQFQTHPTYPLIVVANRDEFYERPTESAHFWEDHPSILAGRDLLQMGTWLGVSKAGRFAALTNFRDPQLEPGHLSRGEIVRNFLIGHQDPLDFIEELKKNRDSYGGYNIVIGDSHQLFHYNNILDEMNEVSPGTHSLSNHTLNTPWPKVEKGKQSLAEHLLLDNIEVGPLFDLLTDESVAKDSELPDTGVGIELERSLSPLFIKMPNYGTRSSTVLLMDENQNITFAERTYYKGKMHSEKFFEI